MAKKIKEPHQLQDTTPLYKVTQVQSYSTTIQAQLPNHKDNDRYAQNNNENQTSTGRSAFHQKPSGEL